MNVDITCSAKFVYMNVDTTGGATCIMLKWSITYSVTYFDMNCE